MSKGFYTVNLDGSASGKIPAPVVGENGNWWIGNDDTGISASGIPGPKGDKGEPGETADISRIEVLEKQMAELNGDLYVLDWTNKVTLAAMQEYAFPGAGKVIAQALTTGSGGGGIAVNRHDIGRSVYQQSAYDCWASIELSINPGERFTVSFDVAKSQEAYFVPLKNVHL